MLSSISMLVCQPSPHSVVFVNVSKPLQVPRVHIVYQWYLEGFIGIHEEDAFGRPFDSRAWLRCGGQAQRAMATQHLRAANAMKQYNGANAMATEHTPSGATMTKISSEHPLFFMCTMGTSLNSSEPELFHGFSFERVFVQTNCGGNTPEGGCEVRDGAGIPLWNVTGPDQCRWTQVENGMLQARGFVSI